MIQRCLVTYNFFFSSFIAFLLAVEMLSFAFVVARNYSYLLQFIMYTCSFSPSKLHMFWRSSVNGVY